MARALGLLAVTSVYAFSHDKSAACYASRYPDLHAEFCATGRCDTRALHDHYKNSGARERRLWGCHGAHNPFGAPRATHVRPAAAPGNPVRASAWSPDAVAARDAFRPGRPLAAHRRHRDSMVSRLNAEFALAGQCRGHAVHRTFTHDESAACYASRYPDLRAVFCATAKVVMATPQRYWRLRSLITRRISTTLSRPTTHHKTTYRTLYQF